jgi:hypothetical protein
MHVGNMHEFLNCARKCIHALQNYACMCMHMHAFGEHACILELCMQMHAFENSVCKFMHL